jgi:protein SCO1/2
MKDAKLISRRSLLALGTGSALVGLLEGQTPNADHGVVKPPVPVPEVSVQTHEGKRTTLRALTLNHVTAIQVMFTQCQSTCPIQAAIFEQVARLIPDWSRTGAQLLSVSIDPGNDGPRALSVWRARFHAGPNWIAAAPVMEDLERTRSFFGPGRSTADNHTTRVDFVNRKGFLVWRSFELPEAEEIAALLRRI